MKKSVALLAFALVSGAAMAGPRGSETFKRDQHSDVIEGRLKIQLKPGVNSEAVGRQIGARPLGKRLGSTGWELFSIPESQDPVQLANRARNLAGVRNAEPLFTVYALLNAPNDRDWNRVADREDLYFEIEGPLEQFNYLWSLDEVNAFSAWQNFPNTWYTALTKPRYPATVTVIDSGVDMNHPDFIAAGGSTADVRGGGQWDFARSRTVIDGKVVPGSNGNDENGHGTHVAGSALAAGNNGAYADHGIIGTGYASQGMNLRIIEANGTGNDFDAALAIMYASERGSDVINMSFGTTDYSQAMQDACTYAFQRGSLLVAAAGEGATPSNLPPFYPAACSGVMAVTAATLNKIPASNYAAPGNYIDISAPGGDVLIDLSFNFYYVFVHSTMPTYPCALNEAAYYFPVLSDYTQLSGTSMAAPHVAGAASHYIDRWNLERRGGWGNIRTMQALERGANNPGATTAAPWTATKGFGDLDMFETMNEANARGATRGAIEGQVYFGTPAVAAVVTATRVGQTNSTASTNSNTVGYYRFPGLPEGEYDLKARAGFNEKTKRVTVVAGANAPGVDFWIGGKPGDTTPPVIARFEQPVTATNSALSLDRWAYDTESGIDSVKLRVGTTKGGSQVRGDTEVDPMRGSTVLSGLGLASNTQYWARMTVTNGSGLSSSIDLPFVATKDPRRIQGTVTLSDFGREPYGVQAVLQFLQNGVLVYELPTLINPDGSYLARPSLEGSFEVRLKSRHFLRGTAGVKTIGAVTTTADFTLTNGDVDGDNVVSIFDYIGLSESFGLAWGEAGFLEWADLDGDDEVTIFDYVILSNSFDQEGL